jgi:four helix bundle protein
MDLAEAIYNATSKFPPEEIYGLRTQLRRAAVSIPSNIAEGQGRTTAGEFKQFLGHARGSLMEVETQVALSLRLKLLSRNDADRLSTLIGDVGRPLNGLMSSDLQQHAANTKAYRAEPPATSY